MKAIALTTNQKGISLIDVPEPQLQAADEIKLRVIEVGICGTDREEISGARVNFPDGEDTLIIGHEMLGEVVEVGAKVTAVQPGDLALFTVRRGCKECEACRQNRADMCYTGRYKERGINRLHGFQTEYVVDREAFVLKLSLAMRSYGALCEPASVVEKAISIATDLQSRRIPAWQSLKGKKVLVAGLGPIGLLAAVVLKLRGAVVYGYDIVDDSSLRATLFTQLGGTYLNGKKTKLADHNMDLVVEAAGYAPLDIELFSCLGSNSIYVLTGVSTTRMVTFDAGQVMERLVLNNQLIVGSVNASKDHWAQAVKDLEEANAKFHGIIDKLITHRIPHQKLENAFLSSPSEIKKVITWV
jgi:threonine dehydrogenase-like Zn-dependent dehydrogenase